jgi:AAA family ATP:ADP antiporter
LSVFWSFMADLFDSRQARGCSRSSRWAARWRSIAGPSIARVLPIESLLFGSIAMLLGAIACALALGRWAACIPNPERRLADTIIGGNWWAGALAMQSPSFLRPMVALNAAQRGGRHHRLTGSTPTTFGKHYPDRESATQFLRDVD